MDVAGTFSQHRASFPVSRPTHTHVGPRPDARHDDAWGGARQSLPLCVSLTAAVTEPSCLLVCYPSAAFLSR